MSEYIVKTVEYESTSRSGYEQETVKIRRWINGSIGDDDDDGNLIQIKKRESILKEVTKERRKNVKMLGITL